MKKYTTVFQNEAHNPNFQNETSNFKDLKREVLFLRKYCDKLTGANQKLKLQLTQRKD